MLEISLNKVCKSYGFNKVLDNLSFNIKTNEKVALIGDNGCGKTTTLRLIMKKEEVDSGDIFVRKDASIGYLCQIPDLEDNSITANDIYLRGVKDLIELENKIKEFSNNMNNSNNDIKTLDRLQEEFRIKGGYEYNTRVLKIKHGFNLSDELLNTLFNNLSGGEKTIVNLASLILSNPDILLLDEPTNHLDIDTLEWFEDYLNNYKGTVIIVSHDRYFLDRVINKIICINNGHEDIYFGNYTYYINESEKRFIEQFQKYKNQQKEIESIKKAIERLKEWGEKSDNPIFFKRAHSMEKRLERMDIIEKPHEKIDLKLNFNMDERSSNTVLNINKLNLSIGDKILLENANMFISFGERVCLMGRNGSGKTTLIKNILNNTHEEIKLGVNIKIGYIPQEIRFDNEELTIYEHMRKIFVGNDAELRSKLHRFYFTSECIDKKIKSLSGGEKVRIKLLELILLNTNFLILDEPTNHIDIDTREILEETLNEYEGTILFISHDRYFINKLATRIVRFENKKLISHIGNYDDIKNINVDNLLKEEVKKEIIIKGSNRLNEFLKDVTSIEEECIRSNYKVYKIRKKSKYFYLKIADHLSSESIRLDYLNDKIECTSKVFYEKYNGKSYMLIKALKGRSLINEHDINIVLNVVCEAFNSLYNIDYSDCIIDETIDTKIKRIEDNIKNCNIPNDIISRFYTKENVIKYLKGNKPKQIIGFIHGNLSLDNIYYDNGHFSGLLNVSNSGLGDIYYDLVACEKSIEDNFGKEYIDLFYDTLGIEKDEFKSDYYRILLSIV